MKHYYISFFLALLMSMVGTNALANDFIDGIYYQLNGSEATVVRDSHDDYSGDVVIPESISYYGKTYKVTSIEKNAFKDCRYLNSVTIGNNVTTVGKGAFTGCYRLNSVILGNSVTDICDALFMNCSSLTSITIGNNVTNIGEFAFAGCSKLTSINIPNSVTSVGLMAFIECI
jgi:hypothetical protein